MKTMTPISYLSTLPCPPIYFFIQDSTRPPIDPLDMLPFYYERFVWQKIEVEFFLRPGQLMHDKNEEIYIILVKLF